MRTAFVLSLLLYAQPLLALPYTWDGGATPDTNLATPGNWVDDVAPDFDLGGDDLTFTGAVNTSPNIRLGTLLGDNVNSVSFDASAAAFSIEDSEQIGNFLWINAGGLSNNSSNLQTFNAPVQLQSSSLNSVTAGFEFNKGLVLAGTNVIDTTVDLTIDGGISSLLDAATPIIKRGAGTLILNAASTFSGELRIGATNAGPNGAVRVTHPDALGLPSGATNRTRLFGGTSANEGRLELANDITLAEDIRMDARAIGIGDKVAIWNVSGNNTMSGTITPASGGNQFNFGSASGKLTIAGNFYAPTNVAFSRTLTFRGPGDGEFTGSIGSMAQAALGNMQVVNYGSGTLTLSGVDNYRVGHLMSVGGGTLKLSATFGTMQTDENFPLFAPTDDAVEDDDITPISNVTRFQVENNSTFNVSELGPFTLDRPMAGTGHVVGTMNAVVGGSVQPGSTHSGYAGDPYYLQRFHTGVGTLNFHDDLSLAGGGDYVWNLGALSTSNQGTDFDQVIVGENLALGGTSTLTLDFSLLSGTGPDSADAFWNSNRSWKIIDTDTNTGDTNFTTINNGTFAGGSFTTSVVAGDILLNYVSASGDLPGDHNQDGKVDAADYVFWRDTMTDIPRYQEWKANFGNPQGSGAVAGVSGVPEPSAISLAALAFTTFLGVRWKHRK